MIDAVRDREGVHTALGEIFEEDFLRARLDREMEGASEETRERMECNVPARTLSPGYYQFALHLFQLESELKAGIAVTAAGLADYEAAGLVVLAAARAAFEGRHPACSTCGARQHSRFGAECHACGVKFRRKR